MTIIQLAKWEMEIEKLKKEIEKLKEQVDSQLLALWGVIQVTGDIYVSKETLSKMKHSDSVQIFPTEDELGFVVKAASIEVKNEE